jgi:hypothetical protein
MESLKNMDQGKQLNIGGIDISPKELREILKLQEELAALEKEQALAKANTTEGDIKASSASETEKILADAAKKKAELEQERLDIETRIGYKEEEARLELEILEKKKAENAATIQAYKDIVDVIEKEITAVTKTETDKRIALYAQEEKRLRDLIALRMNAGVSTGGTPGSTTNNNNNSSAVVNVQATINNNVDVDTVTDTLVKKINNANK